MTREEEGAARLENHVSSHVGAERQREKHPTTTKRKKKSAIENFDEISVLGRRAAAFFGGARSRPSLPASAAESGSLRRCNHRSREIK